LNGEAAFLWGIFIMRQIISNRGTPSLSRNHTQQDSVWQSFDGKSYTCKIGNFIYDWNFGNSNSNSKQFIAIQSPTPTFSYKSYATGECAYFGVHVGTGDTEKGITDYSKLEDLFADLPDPMQFNANWQGVDGSMISWISSENNTNTSDSTFVMVDGAFYNLGRPILGAALNNGFILAIHCTDGVAVLCEYSTKDSKNGSVTKRVEKKINDVFTKDNDEISRVNQIIAELNQLKSSPPHNGTTVSYKVTDSSMIGYHMESTTLSDGMEDAFYDFHMRMKIKRFESYKTLLNTSVKFSVFYRASFSPDLTTMLLHLEGTTTGTNPRHVAEFTSVSLGSTAARLSNGFATFDLKNVWTNEEEIKQAIKDKLPKIPERTYAYTLTFLKSKRFDEPIMDWSSGNGDDGFGGYVIPAEASEYGYGSAARGKLKSDNIFLFAELVGNVPTWLMAKVDINVLTQVRYSTPSNFPRGQLNWKEVVTP
jgi:hypothetical protein